MNPTPLTEAPEIRSTRMQSLAYRPPTPPVQANSFLPAKPLAPSRSFEKESKARRHSHILEEVQAQQADATHNKMAGPHPDAVPAIYPDGAARGGGDGETSAERKERRHREFLAKTRGKGGFRDVEWTPDLQGRDPVSHTISADTQPEGGEFVSQTRSPDHEVQSGRGDSGQRDLGSGSARDRCYGRDRKQKSPVEESTKQQSRQAGAEAVQMGVGGVPPVAAGGREASEFPTVAKGGKCVIL